MKNIEEIQTLRGPVVITKERGTFTGKAVFGLEFPNGQFLGARTSQAEIHQLVKTLERKWST
jgi:hypothetical protein